MSAQILRETLRQKLENQIKAEVEALLNSTGDFGEMRRAQGSVNGLQTALDKLREAYTEIQ